jgi:hypothetical protein
MARPPLIEGTVKTVAADDASAGDFDRWQAFFTANAPFPSGWEGLHVAPPPETPEAEAYEHRKSSLVSEWVERLANRSVVLAHYARQGMRARIARQHAQPACPVCDPFTAREVGPGLETMPPFHPGCRCVALAVHATTARRRTSYERPP